MALHPLEVGMRACCIALLDLGPDSFDEIPILDGALPCPPLILLPVLIPFGDTADRVFAVGVDADILRD